MEERQFFYELCLAVLAQDRHVRFAGVTDENGKLLVGEYRADIAAPLIHSEESYSPNGKPCFDISRLAIGLNKSFEKQLGDLDYQVTKFSKVKLVTVPLTSRNDRILCISLDSMPRCERVVSKLVQAIL